MLTDKKLKLYFKSIKFILINTPPMITDTTGENLQNCKHHEFCFKVFLLLQDFSKHIFLLLK
jgi:hypothetical protein